MIKIKIWEVVITSTGALKPSHEYFSSKEEAEKCYKAFKNADPPKYRGAFSADNVKTVSEYMEDITSLYNNNPKLTYFNSFKEMLDYYAGFEAPF